LAALTAFSTTSPVASLNTSVSAPQTAQPFAEARHAQIQNLDRLLVVDVRRLARLLVHLHPVLRVAVQHAADGRVGLVRVALPRAQEGVLDAQVPRRIRLALNRQLPHARQPRRAAAARRAVIDGALVNPDGDRRRQDRRRDEHQGVAALDRGVLAERVQQPGHRLISIRRGRPQPAQQDLADPERNVRALRRVPHLPLHDVVGQRVHRVARERALAVERLVKRHAEAELIGARVGPRAQELLGRHVRRRAHHRARPGQLRAEHPAGRRVRLGLDGRRRRPRRAREDDRLRRNLDVEARRRTVVLRDRRRHLAAPASVPLGRRLADDDAPGPVARRRLFTRQLVLLVHVAREAEVHDAHLVVASDHDVVRLEVAMDQPLVVSGRQPAPRRHEHLQDVLPASFRRLQPVRDGVPLDELHRDEHLLLKRPDVEHDDDVRVREPRDRLRLAQRALLALQPGDAVARLDPQQLDRDLAIQLRIVRRVHLAHAAAAHQPEDDVATDGGAAGERREPTVLAGRTLGPKRT
jgi:hypothetical protein